MWRAAILFGWCNVCFFRGPYLLFLSFSSKGLLFSIGGLWSTCSSFAGLSFCSGLGLLGCFLCCLCFLKVRMTGDLRLVAKLRNEGNTSRAGARTFLAFFTGSSGSAEGAA